MLSSSAPSPSAARLGGPTPPAEHDTPTIWQTTVADVAADRDALDLPVLVEAGS